jgi:hypothetical protein
MIFYIKSILKIQTILTTLLIHQANLTSLAPFF